MTESHSTFARLLPQGGGGGYCGRSDGTSYCEPKKIHEPEILQPTKYLASKFSTQKNTRLKYLNIDLFNQTDLKT